jgi:hypothetical protein
LFENRKAALGFAGAIVIGAMLFSGFSGSDSDPDIRESQLANPQNTAMVAAREAPADEEVVGFAPDEELIDETAGFEPSQEDESEEINDAEDRDQDQSSSDEGDGPEERIGRLQDFDENGYLRLEPEL